MWCKVDRIENTPIRLPMKFGVFVPPQAKAGAVPVLFYLAGLTCNEETFAIKAGAQRLAAELGLALVTPDTSPRGDDVPDDEGYDFGKGAGFYVDATEAPWATNFRMRSYVELELPELIAAQTPDDVAAAALYRKAADAGRAEAQTGGRARGRGEGREVGAAERRARRIDAQAEMAPAPGAECGAGKP